MLLKIVSMVMCFSLGEVFGMQELQTAKLMELITQYDQRIKVLDNEILYFSLAKYDARDSAEKRLMDRQKRSKEDEIDDIYDKRDPLLEERSRRYDHVMNLINEYDQSIQALDKEISNIGKHSKDDVEKQLIDQQKIKKENERKEIYNKRQHLLCENAGLL